MSGDEPKEGGTGGGSHQSGGVGALDYRMIKITCDQSEIHKRQIKAIFDHHKANVRLDIIKEFLDSIPVEEVARAIKDKRTDLENKSCKSLAQAVLAKLREMV